MKKSAITKKDYMKQYRATHPEYVARERLRNVKNNKKNKEFYRELEAQLRIAGMITIFGIEREN